MDINAEKIEKMKKGIQKKNSSALGIIALANTAMILSKRDFMIKLYPHPEQADFMQGLVTGIAIVIIFVSLFYILRNTLACTDKKLLTRLYNKLNDERELEIQGMAGKKTAKLSPVILLLLSLVVSLFSFEAGLGLIGATFVVCIIDKAFHIYYGKNYTGKDTELS